MFDCVAPTPAERTTPRPGDEIVDPADVVMDRCFDVAAAPEQVWPWIVQLGKRRAGWYLSRRVEMLIPRSRRAIRVIDPAWQGLVAGDVIPDYGGRNETFTVAAIEAPSLLVYRSVRGHTELSWSISLVGSGDSTRVHLRLRMAPVRHRKLAETGGGLVDLLTIAGLARGLRERVVSGPSPASMG